MTEIQKQQVARLRGMGKSYAAIADLLGITENTIKSYCRRNRVGIGEPKAQRVAEDTCANYGCPLEHRPGAKRKRFCSDTCRMAWWKSHPEAVNRKAIYHFVCPVCGVEFESYGNAHRKYCSRACFGALKRDAR